MIARKKPSWYRQPLLRFPPSVLRDPTSRYQTTASVAVSTASKYPRDALEPVPDPQSKASSSTYGLS